MIVGGILICVGLFFSSYKTNAYVAWVDKKTSALASKLAKATHEIHEVETTLKEPVTVDVEVVEDGGA